MHFLASVLVACALDDRAYSDYVSHPLKMDTGGVEIDALGHLRVRSADPAWVARQVINPAWKVSNEIAVGVICSDKPKFRSRAEEVQQGIELVRGERRQQGGGAASPSGSSPYSSGLSLTKHNCESGPWW